METSPRGGSPELPSRELALLELMAALWVPLSRSALPTWLKATGHRLAAAQVYGNREVSAILDQLVRRGLVASEDEGRRFRVVEEQRHAVLARAHRERRLQGLVELIRRIEPLRLQRGWTVQREAAIREFAWSMHLGLSEDMRKEFASWSPSYGIPREVLLATGFGADPPASGLESLPIEIVSEYLGVVTAFAIRGLNAMAPTLLVFADTHAERLPSEVRQLLALLLALRAEPARALALLPAGDDAAGLAMRAFIALASDQVSDARRLAREAIERSRSRSTKRVKGVESPVGPWLVLVLLTDADALSHPYARAQLAYETKRSTSPVHTSLQMLDELVSSASDDLSDVPMSLARLQTTWTDELFWALLMRFRGKALPRNLIDRLKPLTATASSQGFGWVQHALEAVVSTSSAHSLLGLYAIDAPWQRTLRALEAAIASDRPAAEGGEVEERLAWVFTLEEDGDFQLSARLQSRTRGGWTSGRELSWKRLAEATPGSRYITDRDRRVIRHIYVDRDSFRYGGTGAAQLAPLAASELVGHPLVFEDHDLKTALEVITGASRLEVREEAGAVTLTLAPEALLDMPVVCEREGPSRLVVYVLDEAQQRVAKIFQGSPIVLPAQAREAAHDTLAKLAGRFSLSSDQSIAAGQIEEVPADGRIRVRLRRYGEGVAVRVCVVPLEDASAQLPGEGSARRVIHVPAEHGTKAVCAVRDLEAERQALQALYATCPTLADVLAGEHEGKLDDLERCLELLCELRACAASVEWPEGHPFALTAERDVRNVRLKLGAAADWLAADGELEIDAETRLSLHELLARTAKARGRFIALDDGRFVALTDKLKKRLEGIAALAVVKNAKVTLHPLWLGIAGLTDDYAELKCDAETTRLLARVREASQLAPTVPATFEAELRVYQQQGFEWLCRLAHVRAGACLADDMGLGKTLQALALLLTEAAQGPSLVVAPTSVCLNWIDEARRFVPTLKFHELASSDRADTIRRLGPSDVLVSSYGLVQQELENLSSKHFRVVILDEAQAIKNASTQRARAVQQLVADIRIALTGTPVENHLGELWSIMHFLNPGLLGSVKAFEERFAKPITRDADPRAASTLKRLIRPFVLRRRKSEVLEDLPSKTVITLRVQPNEAESALFVTLRERALARVGDSSRTSSSPETRFQLLAELTRLRRAACHPKLVAPEADIPSSKLEAFETLLAELREGGHRVLVFSQFIDYLGIIKARLEELGVSYQYLDGSCSMAARQRSVSAFQSGEGEAFLISLKAGGFGLNLTAADYVIHLDPWWNPAVEEQASDRAHRIGQTRPVTIYRLVMQHSIEEKILDLHAHKRDLADRLLEGTSSASLLSLEQLLSLIRSDATPNPSAP